MEDNKLVFPVGFELDKKSEKEGLNTNEDDIKGFEIELDDFEDKY